MKGYTGALPGAPFRRFSFFAAYQLGTSGASEVSVPGLLWEGAVVSQEIERLVRNQILFREVNERVRETIDDTEGPVEFLCECSNEACIETAGLEMKEYDRIRAHPNLFLVVPGHELLDVDRVVGQGPGFLLVEKIVAVDEVIRADRRSRAVE